MKTITMYELLGMVKDGKAPKRIRIRSAGGVYDKEFYFDGNIYMYKDEYEEYAMTDDISIEMSLNDEVEILEEEKKIPEKEKIYKIEDDLPYESLIVWQRANNKIFEKQINEIIDYLDYLKSKGDK